MYIAVIPNRTSPPAILLRESFRQHGQVKNRQRHAVSAQRSHLILEILTTPTPLQQRAFELLGVSARV